VAWLRAVEPNAERRTHAPDRTSVRRSQLR
jgi:hypothetical protein